MSEENTKPTFLDEIKKATEIVEDNIREQEEYKHIIESLSETDVVDEDLWHRICETPLGFSSVMGRLAENIFPDAKDIKVYCNDVKFTLMGFDVRISTSLCRGISVDTSFYNENLFKEYKMYLSPEEQVMQKYFELVDSGTAKWDEKARCCAALSNRPWSYRKWFLWILWTTNFKHHLPDRKEWENILSERKKAYEKSTAERMEKIKKQREKAIVLFDQLLPELKRFSNYCTAYDTRCSVMSLEKIAELENIPYTPPTLPIAGRAST